MNNSIPLIAPFYPHPPYWYGNLKRGMVVFNLEKDIVRSIIPPPLRASGTPNSYLYISKAETSSFGKIHEAGLLFAVRYREKHGLFCPIMYTDALTALAAYREQLGLPAKDAEISYAERNNRIYAKVERNNTVLIDLELYYFDNLKPEPEIPKLSHRVIPDLQDGREIDEVVEIITMCENKTSHAGTAQMTLAFTEDDPLAYFQPRYILGGVRDQYVKLATTDFRTIEKK